MILLSLDASSKVVDLGIGAKQALLPPGQAEQTEAAAAEIKSAMEHYAYGNVYAYEGKVQPAKTELETAADMFAGLAWKYPLAGFNGGDLLPYADKALELARRPAATANAQVCFNRINQLNHELLWYATDHGRFPADLATLEKWCLAKGEDPHWLALALRCPAGDGPGTNSMPYLYNPKVAQEYLKLGTVIVSCPKHPEHKIAWEEELMYGTLGEVASGGKERLRKLGEMP